jgi:polar amino acid transport system substrate-binding protein
MFQRNFTLAAALAFAGALFWASAAAAQSRGATDLAPGGTLRVAMIGANPVLVAKNPDGSLRGISVELATVVAKKIGAKISPVVYDTPEAYTRSFGKNEWDIAIGPRRAADADKVDYAPDFMYVDNIYIAAPGKPFKDASEVDKPGVRIAVAQDGAPDKYLTTALKAASLVRVGGTVAEAVAVLRDGKADVYGSNGEFVFAIAQQLSGSAIVPGAFTTVPMAAMLPKDRSGEAHAQLVQAVTEAIATGLPRRVIERDNLKGVRPAGP